MEHHGSHYDDLYIRSYLYVCQNDRETPEVRSDKRKSREDRQKKRGRKEKKREKREKMREKQKKEKKRKREKKREKRRETIVQGQLLSICI